MRHFTLFFIAICSFSVISLSASVQAKAKTDVHCQIKDGKNNCIKSELTYESPPTLVAQKRAEREAEHKKRTTLHIRSALPLATFFTALLIVPLGLGIGRLGTSVYATASLALVFLWYTLYFASSYMGYAGTISPFWAAWTPNILFAILGFCIWLFLYRHDFSNPFTGIYERFLARAAAPGSSLSKRH